MDYDLQREKKKKCIALISYVAIIFGLIGMVCISADTGSLKVSFPDLLKGLFLEYNEDVYTIYDLRFPRILIAVLSGAAVATSGCLFQAVLKNPLADPGILGISSGAGLASVAILTIAPQLYFFTPIFAFCGGFIAFGLVYALSWKGRLSPMRMILVGVALNACFTGLLDACDSLSGGNLSTVTSIVNSNITQKTWSDVSTLFPYVLIGLILALCCAGACNLLNLEEQTTRSLGVHVDRNRFLVSMIAVLLAGISTAVAGPISFLGLLAPHIGRILVGSNHRMLMPFSMLFGATLFLLADTMGRTICYPYEISASVIMCCVGGPFFILLLRRSKNYANAEY